MNRIPDFEIAIHPRNSFGYPIDVQYLPGNVDTIEQRSALIPLIPGAQFVLPPPDDKDIYGARLGELLFSPEVREAFLVACENAGNLKSPLRFRLRIRAPDLHNICWEALKAPKCAVPLATDEHFMFSRFLSSSSWRHVKIRSRTTLRALVLIAHPKALEKETRYPPFDVKAQLDCAKCCLSGFEVTELIDQGATTENLIAHLREDFDVLYIVCHGHIAEDDTVLLLDDGDGGIAWVPGRTLSNKIAAMLPAPPGLAVLAPCNSGGMGAWSNAAVTTLGPQLALAGIPAVIGMQGKVGTHSILKFFPEFFRRLCETGEVDRAITAARSSAKDDWWIPVLYMRLRSGRIWYEPGWFDPETGTRRPYPKWDTLVDRIAAGNCTPILGPDLSERLFGLRRDIATRWAQTFHFPMEAYRQEDIAQVAQYLAATEDRALIVEQLLRHIRKRLLEGFMKDLPPELRQSFMGTPQQDEAAHNVNDLIRAVGRVYRQKNLNEPHRLLAKLQLPIYITAELTSQLEDAIADEHDGHNVAHTEICRWKRRPAGETSEIPEPPTPQHPWVYHLFGHLSDVDSLVLTEDDYFDYLIGTTQIATKEQSKKGSVLFTIASALNHGPVLYLGFDLEGRDFRIATRVLSPVPRGGENYAGIAVQIDPEDDRIAEPERAREYVARHLRERHEKAEIYWGAPQNLLEQLFKAVESRKVRDGIRHATGTCA
jgi:hypothetical protein